MGALVHVYRPAFMPGDNPTNCSNSDQVDHLVVVNLRGPFKLMPGETGYKLVAHDRYPRRPMLVPVKADGTAEAWGPSGNFAGSEVTAGWCEAVEKITGGVSNLVAVYDDGFEGDVK